MTKLTPSQLEIANLIVDTLHLEVAPGDIEADAALLYDGLGLDSIDALELALEISKCYGFDMRANDEENEQIFASLQNLAAYIEKNRTT